MSITLAYAHTDNALDEPDVTEYTVTKNQTTKHQANEHQITENRFTNLESHSKFDIDKCWQFHTGDLPNKILMQKDKASAKTAWQTVNVPGLLNKHPTDTVVGWYQVTFDTPKRFNQKPQLALYIGGIRHGDETWLNGVKIGQTGTVTKAWDFLHANPQNSPRLYTIPANLLKTTGNQLAIKVNIGFGKAVGAIYPGGTGITAAPVTIGEHQILQKIHQKRMMGNIAMDVIFIILGLFDLFLILILLRHTIDPFPEYPWLLTSSVLMLVGVVAHDFFYYFNIFGVYANSIYVISLLLVPVCNAMYFWSLQRNEPKQLFYGIFGLQSLLCVLLLLPVVPSLIKAYAWMGGLLINWWLFIYVFYISIMRVRQKHIGASIQLFGILVYVISIPSKWLPDFLFAHRNVQIGSMVFRFAILLAYIQQIHQLRQAYHQTVTKLLEAVENTRQYIARELHDGIGQHLASAKLFANLTAKHADADKTWHSQHNIIQNELSDAITGVRRTIVGLHTATLEKMSLMDAIHQETTKLEQLYDVAIDVNVTQPTSTFTLFSKAETNSSVLESFTLLQKEHVFRLLQECINNAIFHGEASHIAVKITIKKYHVELNIADNGKGFKHKKAPLKPEQRILSHDNKVRGYGLINLEERVALLHGRLLITSQVGTGTKVTIIVPLALNSQA